MAKFKSPRFPKNDILVTPAGVAEFPWLTKADTKFNKDGLYHTGLVLNPEDKGHAAFMKKCGGILKAAITQCEEAECPEIERIKPFKPQVDKDGNETGMVVMNAKTFATQKGRDDKEVKVQVSIVDAKRNPLASDVPVYGGSILKLAVRPKPYCMKDKRSDLHEVGLTFYISGVQVLELKSGGGGDFFDEEDGYTTSAEECPFDEDAAPEASDTDDEDEDDLY